MFYKPDLVRFDEEYDVEKGKCHAVNVTGGTGMTMERLKNIAFTRRN